MLEATPGKPWGIDLKDLLDVEQDMKQRFVEPIVLACTKLILRPDERLPKTT